LTAGPLDAEAQRLVALANERGGKDNITAVVIRALPDARPERQAVVREIGTQMEVLRQVRLFRHLAYKELVMLLNITTAETRPAGVTVIREGEPGTDCYIVLGGQVQVSQQGKVLATLSPGDHFGEMELIAARPRSATVSTLATTELLKLGRDAFIGLLKANEHLALKLLWSFLQTLSVRLHTTNRKLSAALEEEETAAPF
jgi:CRP-like cAMP-binding protein